MSQNGDVVRGLYEAFGRGDVPAVLSAFDGQIHWNEAEGFKYANHSPYVGPKAVAEGVFLPLVTTVEGFGAHPEQFIDCGDTVVVEGRYRGTMKATGIKVDAQFAHFWHLKAGKIVGFHQYTDTRQWAEAEASPILSRDELLAALQKEVRILQHLATKVDAAQLDYRPTPAQRSTGELIKYLSMMGPTIVEYVLGDPPDIAVWTAAEEAAKARSVEQAVAVIADHPAMYARLLSGATNAQLRAEVDGFDGTKTSRGAFIVNLVLSGCAAYRTQLFLYLKAGGREELNSSNLWEGVDATVPA